MFKWITILPWSRFYLFLGSLDYLFGSLARRHDWKMEALAMTITGGLFAIAEAISQQK